MMTDKEVIQYERAAAVIERACTFPIGPYTWAEFDKFIGRGYTYKPARDLINEHFCMCKDGFIRIRSLTASLAWLRENLTG